jgi:RNA polymerase sigma factor (sigma-70 family)
VPFGVVDEGARDPMEHVVPGSVGVPRRRLAETRRELAQQHEADARVSLDEPQKVDRRDRLHDDVVERDHRGRPRGIRAGECVEISDELPRPAHSDEDIATVCGGADDFQAARPDHEDVIAAIALEDDERPAVEPAHDTEIVELCLQARGERREGAVGHDQTVSPAVTLRGQMTAKNGAARPCSTGRHHARCPHGRYRSLIQSGMALTGSWIVREMPDDWARSSTDDVTVAHRRSERDPDPSFEEWFRRLHPFAYKVGYRFRRGDTGFAEDVAQESLARAYAAWSRIHDHPNLEAWITVTALRVSFELDRQQRRAGRRASTTAVSDPSTEEQRLADADLLTRALGRVSARQQQVLMWRFYFDQSVQQTAQRLGLTESKVKDATHEAVIKLAPVLRRA